MHAAYVNRIIINGVVAQILKERSVWTHTQTSLVA